MNKTKLTKLKKQVNKSIMDSCDEEDILELGTLLEKTIEDYFNPPILEKKSYIASTGGSVLTSVVRTRGQSEKSDSARGKG